jgi:PAS domain S-box-containing protein
MNFMFRRFRERPRPIRVQHLTHGSCHERTGSIRRAMARWTFFTNHLRVLTTLAGRPDLRLREIALEVGITERAAHRIIGDLVEEGYLTRTRVGSRNRYEIHPEAARRHPLHAEHRTDRVIALLTGDGVSGEPEGAVASDAERPWGDMFGEVFRSAPAGMVVGDERGRLVAVNRAFCAIVGRRDDELVGQDFRGLTSPTIRAPASGCSSPTSSTSPRVSAMSSRLPRPRSGSGARSTMRQSGSRW